MLKVYNDVIGKTNLNYAYNIIKQNILRLDLKPGEEIKDSELQILLKMSRTPIREAILLLKHEGLIETFHQLGTFVSKIDKQKYRDGRLLRICLETKVLNLACEDFPAEYLKKLEDILERQKYVMDMTRDHKEFHKLDIEFHKTIFAGVGYKNVFELSYSGFSDYMRIRELNATSKINDNFVIDGHYEIYDIIKNKKTKEIEKVINEHFSKLDPKLKYFIETYPYYFK